MHALRLHKGIVPGRDKLAREARRLQQVTRQRGARRSILQGLRSFLTADSFMYGPLMESPPIVHTSDDSEPHTPDREQENGGLDDGSTGDDTNGVEENDTNEENGKNIDNGHDESAIRRYQGSRASKTILSVQRTSARMTARTALPPADGSRTPSSTVRVMKLSRNGT